MYHIFDNEAQHGPYPLEKLRLMRDSGIISAEALYWDEDASEWLCLEDKFHHHTAVSQPRALAPALPAALNQRRAARAVQTAAPALKAPSGLRRCVAFFIDAALFGTLPSLGADAAQEMKIVIKDPWASIIGVSYVLAAIGLRDIAFGGRSLGRRITFSCLMKRETLTPASHWTSFRRNLLAAGLLIVPFFFAIFLGASLGSMLGGLLSARTLGAVAVGTVIFVIKSADNPTGQGWWDTMLDTVVACKAGPEDKHLPSGPKEQGES